MATATDGRSSDDVPARHEIPHDYRGAHRMLSDNRRDRCESLAALISGGPRHHADVFRRPGELADALGRDNGANLHVSDLPQLSDPLLQLRPTRRRHGDEHRAVHLRPNRARARMRLGVRAGMAHGFTPSLPPSEHDRSNRLISGVKWPRLDCGRRCSYGCGVRNSDEGEAAPGRRVSGKVMIVEDQLLVAELFAAHCRGMGLDVVAQCDRLETAASVLRKHKPDLVLLDFSMPDGNGLEAGVKWMEEMPQLRVIGVSSHRDPWTMLQVQRSGLHGFVDKNEQRPDVLSEAIEAVLFGRTFYTSIVSDASRVLRHDRTAFVHVLSDYEMRVLALIGEAKDDNEIGAILGVSPSTVQSRRRDIMRKLNIHSTPKLIHYALAHGLVRTEHLRDKRPPQV
ncbi:MAG: hypothetical protein C0518_13370 [Opitutus sp.]|nr:hypothetical protein [Opitutus sp.]